MGAAKKIKARSAQKIKILVADDDGQNTRRTIEFLNYNGFDCRGVSSGQEAKAYLLDWKPQLVIADLMLNGGNAFDLMRFTRGEPALSKRNIKFIVISGHSTESNVQEAFKRGASDFLPRPVVYQDLLTRVILHCRDPRDIDLHKSIASKDHWSNAEGGAPLWSTMEELFDIALKELGLERTLYELTKLAAKKTKGVRCSVVRFITYSHGVVVASSDDPQIAGLNLDLTKYPEIQLAINTNKMIAIDNLEASTSLKKIIPQLKNINFNSMIICPVYNDGKTFGAISMRMDRSKTHLPDEDIQFIKMLSKMISIYLNTQNLEEISKYGLTVT